jgi:hypothetical protein
VTHQKLDNLETKIDALPTKGEMKELLLEVLSGRYTADVQLTAAQHLTLGSHQAVASKTAAAEAKKQEYIKLGAKVDATCIDLVVQKRGSYES